MNYSTRSTYSPYFSCLNLVLAILVFLLIPQWASSEAPELFSHFQPYISLQEEYTDNLDLTRRNRIDDFITTISPGLRISSLPRSARTGEFRPASTSPDTSYGFDCDYRAGFVFYAEEDDRNYVSVDGTLSAWYTWERRLTFRVNNYSIRSQEPREPDYSPTALPGQYLLSTERIRETYFRNVLRPSVEYRFGRENRVALNYVNNIYRTENPFSQDSTENYFSPTLDYWFDVRNGVSFEYGLLLGDFERSPDLTGHVARGRYTHRFSPRTQVFGEYTFASRDFDPPEVDYRIHVPAAGIEHSFTRTLSGRARLGWVWYDPKTGSKESRPFYDLGLTQTLERTRYTLSFLGGYTEDFFTAQNLGFVIYHRVFLAVSHQLLQRLTVGVTGSVEWADYVRDPLDRKDTIWGVSGSASYQVLRWLSLSLDVGHRQNNSNIDAFDYKENRAMFRATAAY